MTERTQTVSEQTWIERSISGDRQAFGELVKIYMRRAYFVALGIVGNHEDASDLSQDAFLRAFRAMKTFRHGADFYPWFHRILRNVCLTHLRKKNRKPDSVPLAGEDFEWQVPGDEETPDDRVERIEMEAHVWQILRGLPSSDKEIIILRDINDLSYAEIAEALGICANTVGLTRQHFTEGGIEGSLNEKPRSGRPREFTGREEAKLTLIACSDPPEGRNRWSVRLLADKMVELDIVDSISREWVRKYLKKGISSRG